MTCFDSWFTEKLQDIIIDIYFWKNHVYSSELAKVTPAVMSVPLTYSFHVMQISRHDSRFLICAGR